VRVFEAEQTAAYAREDSLYNPYREGMGEASVRMAITIAGERDALESQHLVIIWSLSYHSIASEKNQQRKRVEIVHHHLTSTK
jgi:hypothetical protein